MNPTLMRGVIVVTFALAFYSVAVMAEQRKKTLSRKVLYCLTAGVCLDVSSTALMIIGSRNLHLTVHGVIGYAALAAMLADTTLVWRLWRKQGPGCSVPRWLNLYTRYAYVWWVIAYVAGAIIAIVLGD